MDQAIQSKVDLSNEKIKIYDPFYCDGRTKKLLNELGYKSVIHEKRDFYSDIKNKKIPLHHVFVTNPPYSDDHKRKVFDFVWDRKDIPYFLLMPSYVAGKEYYRKNLQTLSDHFQFIYVVPSSAYEYDHPEGTGKSTPPFFSIWFCGLPSDMNIDIETIRNRFDDVRIATTLNELEEWKIITTKNRMNPKKRKKLKRKLERETNQFNNESQIIASSQVQSNGVCTKEHRPIQSKEKGKKTKSKHRDENGMRKKQRF